MGCVSWILPGEFYSIPVRFPQFRQLLWYSWQIGDISNSQPPELASEIGGFLQLHQRETQHRKTTRISNCQSTIERGSQGHCAVSHTRIPAQNATELMAISRDQGNSRQKLMNQNMSFWKKGYLVLLNTFKFYGLGPAQTKAKWIMKVD